MAERDLQGSIVNALNAQPDTLARVNGPGPAHVVGDPDIYGCVNGLMFHMEVKMPKGKLKEAQAFRLKEWKSAGAQVFVVTSVTEALQAHALVWCMSLKNDCMDP